ncbi:type II toxin-antitoxin system YafQ family toxin [Paenibacillus sp.]
MNKHLDIVWTNQFKKDYKLAMKRHLDIDLLDDVIRKLASGEQLPEEIVALRASSRIYELSVQLLPSA